jgi:SAM-dependent methyltransferase
MDVQPSDQFSVVAAFYDLDLEGYDDDIAMYRSLAVERAAPVLELGCGTGRVAVPLSQAGLDVTGVDVSEAMLTHARERAAAEGVTTLTLLQDDMRELDLDRRFGTVLIPLGGLQHMESVDDLVEALTTVAEHLEPDGIAVVDIEAPYPDDLTPGPQPLIEHWTREADGDSVTKLVSVEPEPSVQLKHVSWHFDVQPAEGPMQRYSEQFALRVISAGELELAARLAGLSVSGWYGDYDLGHVDDGDERIVAILEPAILEPENVEPAS